MIWVTINHKDLCNLLWILLYMYKLVVIDWFICNWGFTLLVLPPQYEPCHHYHTFWHYLPSPVLSFLEPIKSLMQPQVPYLFPDYELGIFKLCDTTIACIPFTCYHKLNSSVYVMTMLTLLINLSLYELLLISSFSYI